MCHGDLNSISCVIVCDTYMTIIRSVPIGLQAIIACLAHVAVLPLVAAPEGRGADGVDAMA
jgi:hypothetical protein